MGIKGTPWCELRKKKKRLVVIMAKFPFLVRNNFFPREGRMIGGEMMGEGDFG